MPATRLLQWPTTAAISLLMLVCVVGLVLNRSSALWTKDVPTLMPMAAIVTSPGLNMSLPARPAAFGPMFPVKAGEDTPDGQLGGFTGSIAVVNSLGCRTRKKSANRPEDLREKIALVQRGGCSFYEKVLTLQDWGAVAVLIGDNTYHGGLVTMYTRDEIDASQIPSAFISRDSYDMLALLDIVTITRLPDSAPMMTTVIFLMVSPLCSLSIIYGLLLFHRRYRLLKERAPKSLVDSLPTRIWYPPVIDTSSSVDASDPATGLAGHRPEKVWVSSGECIICLEDFEPGTSLVMQLPCGHEFHADCISKWLVFRRKTCPICKQDVTAPVATRPHTHESPLSAQGPSTETTPLISPIQTPVESASHNSLC